MPGGRAGDRLQHQVSGVAIGAQIVAARADLGWSQGQLADRAGMNHSRIGLYERGEAVPTMPTIMVLDGALGGKLSTDHYLAEWWERAKAKGVSEWHVYSVAFHAIPGDCRDDTIARTGLDARTKRERAEALALGGEIEADGVVRRASLAEITQVLEPVLREAVRLAGERRSLLSEARAARAR